MRKLAIVAVASAALALLVGSSLLAPPGAAAELLINGAGATFPYPIYSKWFDEYAKAEPSLRFNYQSIGSGGGIRQITERTVDFGASDGPMTDEQLAKAPGNLSPIPTGRGPAAPRYNRPANPPLPFPPTTLPTASPGRTGNGKAPRIQAANPGGALPGD